ncbi:MAG: tetratricopeptide repeat protein [Pseudolabrys sp.]
MRHQPIIVALALVGTLATAPTHAASQVPESVRAMPGTKLCTYAVPPGKDYAAAVYSMQIAACTNAIEAVEKQGKKAGPLYTSRGAVYARQNDCRHAIADFSKAIAQDSGALYAYLGRGLCYRKAGKIDKALVDFDSAIAAAQGRKAAGVKDYIKPDALFTLFIERGNILLKLGQALEAQRSFKAALFLRPKDKTVKASLAKATAQVKASQINKKLYHACSNPKPDKAIASCTQIINSPNVPANMKAAAYQKRGIAYDRQGKRQKALADFTTVLASKPGNGPTLLMRGVTYAQIDQLDEAIADFSAAIDYDHDYAKAYTLRGRAYEQKGALQKAAADYTKAIALAPQSVDARERLKGLKSKLHAGAPTGTAGNKPD